MSLNFNCDLFALFESACEMNQGQTSTGPTFSLSDLPPPPFPHPPPPQPRRLQNNTKAFLSLFGFTDFALLSALYLPLRIRT